MFAARSLSELLCLMSYARSSLFEGKLFAGYQGWFATSCDQSPANKWIHWSRGSEQKPNSVTFEVWPDVRDYDPRDLCATPQLGSLGNGHSSSLYNAYSSRVIDTLASRANAAY